MTSPSRWGEAWRTLTSLPPLWGVLLGRAPHRARLPIDFLPGDVGTLRVRKPAVLLLGDAAVRQSCMRKLLETELALQPVTWLGTDEAELRALGPAVEAAARRGRLRGLAWAGGAAKALRERGPAYLLHELAACGLHRHELLIVDLLAPWLQGPSDESDVAAAVLQAVAALKQWARLHRGAPLLGLAPVWQGGQALLPLFDRSALPCVAQLHQHGEQVHFEVVRWPQGPTGTVQDLGFGLVERADGGWQADGSGLALDAHALATASDAERVVTLAAALDGAEAAPAGWQVCAGLPDVVVACRYLVAATVLLPYRAADELPTLVETVRRLRAAHPHALKIVVREVGMPLRYNQELALLRVGANGVVHRAADFARVQQTLVELRHTSFGRRAAPESTPELLRTTAADPVRGYLPLSAFCDAAERMIERTAPTGMEHCIVQLPLLPQVAHLDALAACQIARDGDLVTADERALWLFLFACRAPDVEAALKRLFTLPPSVLFNQMRVRPEPDTMHRAIERLRRHGVDAVTDYSDALLALQPARLPLTDSGFVALQPEGQDTLPAPLDEVPPRPQPRPPERIQLRLRP